MIQRIQTLLLILAAGLNFAVLFLPLGAAFDTDTQEATVELSGTSIHQELWDEAQAFEANGGYITKDLGLGDNTFLLVHAVLVVLVSLFLIGIVFLYNDRVRQMRLTYAGIVMVMIQLVVAALLFMQLPEMLGGSEEFRHDIAYGFFFPVGAILLALFAARRIKHDENLVRSSDRLR